MRSLAGFGHSRPESYYIARDCLRPPQSLCRKIFPDLEYWKGEYAAGRTEKSLSAESLFDLFEFLRIVFLQDSVILRQKLQHQIFDSSIFHDPEFIDYERRLLSTIGGIVEDPTETRVNDVIPDVMDLIRSFTQETSNGFKRIEALLKENHKRTEENSIFISSMVNLANNFSSHTGTSGTSSGTPPTGVQEQFEYRELLTASEDTVRALWIEWVEGFSGRPSVEEMDRKYGTKKWLVPSGRKKYERRSVIIKYVKNSSLFSVNKEAAIEEADRVRGSRSLHKFGEDLTKSTSS